MNYPTQMGFWMERIKRVYPDVYAAMDKRTRAIYHGATLTYNRMHSLAPEQIIYTSENGMEKWGVTFSPEWDLLNVNFPDSVNHTPPVQRSLGMQLTRLLEKRSHRS